MATVTCKYCGKKFDRQKEPYIQIPRGQTFRYAHAQCYLDAVNAGKEKERYEIYDPHRFTNCFWCNKAILPTDKDVMELPDMYGRYAHKTCVSKHPADDTERLKVYIIQLYKCEDDALWPKLMLQAQTIAKDYNFTYSGIMKSLEYFHRVKKNPVDTKYGIGIIPYVYNEAKEYYYKLYLAQHANDDKDLSQYVPKDEVIHIKPPKKQPTRRKLFSFLEKEVNDGF